ncbi:MAG TPA: hypothetical protein DCS07_05275 [Bdellovibrionales bacterium]|nr:MAG: hypothetical protein A2Z97_03120 [Bdellovibrionales bacterium GWB1_52_6]OFZ06346.1 MAG: hypothetical protein A2X97_02685 [Bdellovibrionales bacterium GWA1_52_35]OFZ36570.1 MAG: hypothetical protein A2070_09510 [Bdellovibrionales bacterium GWC1_52_8]HAR42031.1 hypothetical protein [Bdellovibrionales bacterium]HCM40098.1 hypothetical protein [Bdellovibrionales bacterium]
MEETIYFGEFNMSKKFAWVVCSIIGLSLSGGFAIAAPAITAVSGTVGNGQSVTISGSGFGTKSRAAPIKFDMFENGTAGSSLNSRDSSWVVYECANGGIPNPNCDRKGALYYNTYARSGNLSVGRHIVNYENFNTNHFTYSPPTQEMFISYWWRTANADTNDDSIVKMSRINSSPAAGGSQGSTAIPFYNGSGNTSLGGTFNFSNGSGPYCAFNNGVNMSELFYSNGVAYLAAPPKNTWIRVEMYKKLSTAGVNNGSIFINMLGVDSASNTSAMTRASGYSFLLDTVLLGTEDGRGAQDDGTGGLHNYDIFLDDMYIDSTQARVEICNTSTWSARTACDAQPATAWSAGSITFTVNSGPASASPNRYLYVVDSTGAVNANGRPITIDGTSTIKVPSAPGNLSVH